MDLFDAEIRSIITLTLRMTITSTLISTIIGIPLGLWLEKAQFMGKKAVIIINQTLMASPPVVIGLVVYLMLMRNGPLGFMGLLFTFEAMVIAQVLLITPIVCGMTYTVATSRANNIRVFARTMGASKWQTLVLLIKELSNDMYFIVIAGFSRAMSEVGAIMIVGGNIRHHTRTMTTSISMMRNRGEFDQAIVLGAVLMGIVLVIQVLSGLLRRKEEKSNENY